MVKQKRRTERFFLPAEGNRVARVQFPVCPAQRRQPPPRQASGRNWTSSGTGDAAGQLCSSSTTTEEGGQLEPYRGSGEMESKRTRLHGCEEAAALVSGEKPQGSRGPADDQQDTAEHGEDSRAAELHSVGSLKVTIQQSSESREFGQTDGTADRQTGGLHCHVCNLSCRSLQLFQDHMLGPDHLKKLQEITQSISVNAQMLQDGGRRADTQRWCDTCQTHFSGDVIAHRRTKQHKMCKQLSRPFCPMCRRHFRTPRKFVEHMKSAAHKQQVQLAEAQDDELITVDAVGCFEEEEQGNEAEEEEVDVAEEEEKMLKTTPSEETSGGEDDSLQSYESAFVVPVSGFLCRLCNKFFYRETTARRTHCRTHAHHQNLQRRFSQGTNSEGGT